MDKRLNFGVKVWLLVDDVRQKKKKFFWGGFWLPEKKGKGLGFGFCAVGLKLIERL